MSFPTIISEISWILMLGVTSFGVKLLKDLSISVDGLNQNILSAIKKLQAHGVILDNHESRIGRLENGKNAKKS